VPSGFAGAVRWRELRELFIWTGKILMRAPEEHFLLFFKLPE